MDGTEFDRKATEISQMNHKFKTNIKSMKSVISHSSNKRGAAIRLDSSYFEDIGMNLTTGLITFLIVFKSYKSVKEVTNL